MPLAAISYLIPPPDYLWRWAGDGSAVEWEDGSTVCLWMELHALLHYLAPQGLPPLGSILMVLMACRQSAAGAHASAREFATRATGGDEASASSMSLLRRLSAVLETVSQLPEDLRSGLPAKAHLLTNLFEGIANRISAEESAKILDQADTWSLPQLLPHPPALNGLARLLRDLKAIAGVHQRQDLRSLEARLRTGLEFVEIRPAELPEPPRSPGGSALPLLRQLENHHDSGLSALAAAARRMVAMFSLPRPAGFPQELPVGGISDITNRGPLDRLLPSELAADDDVLMARLANGEALYYRRDSPPDEPATERVILMDSGIQTWGLPRVFLLAAALGLQEGAKGESVSVHRRNGPVFQPLSLGKITDVRACLEFLSPDPAAAAALSDFPLDTTSGSSMEVFFLTTPGVREPVRRALHDLACRIGAAGGKFYRITISRSGAVELSAHSRAGSRVVCTGRIDPDIILKSPSDTKPENKPKDLLTNLPELIRHLGFYQQYPLPFRFPVAPDRPDRTFLFAHWRIGLDVHRRLMMWNRDPQQAAGAGEIAADLPPCRDWHVSTHDREWVVVCCGNGPGHQARAVRIGMEKATRQEVALQSSHPFPLWMKSQNGAAVLGYTDKAEACLLEDGSRVDSIALEKGTRRESVVFDGRKLAIATPPTDSPPPPPVPPPALPKTDLPPLLGAPVSVGFVASGTLVIRAHGGHWELSLPDFVFKQSMKIQLNAVRPFRRWPQEEEEAADRVPAFYTAEWHPDCRMIFDTRGLLHLLFTDGAGRVELCLLCLIGKPVAAWLAHLPQPLLGNPAWLLKPPAEPEKIDRLVPLLQRFAALARHAPQVQDDH